MNTNVARTVASALALMSLPLVLLAAPLFAQSPAKSVKDQLIGRWQLVSITINGNPPYGPDPKGSMFYDADGHYSVVVLSAGGARNIAYFGTYSVNEGESSVTMHIDGSTRASAEGRDQKRIVSFSGNELIQDNPPSTGPHGAIRVTWKR